MTLSRSPHVLSSSGTPLLRRIPYTAKEERDVQFRLPRVRKILTSIADQKRGKILRQIADLLWERRNVDMTATDTDQQPTTVGLSETIFRTREFTPQIQDLITQIRDLVRKADIPLTIRHEPTVYGNPRPYAWRIENSQQNGKTEPMNDASCTEKEWREIKKRGSEAYGKLYDPELKKLLQALLQNRDGCLTWELRQLWEHVNEPAIRQSENMSQLTKFFNEYRILLQIIRLPAGAIRSGVRTGMNFRYLLRLTQPLAHTEENK